MKKVKNELILDVSGINTQPFKRFGYHVSLDELITILTEKRKECIERGYSNLEIYIDQMDGMVDMSIHGDRNMTEDEINTMERMLVIARQLDKTSKGLTRETILKKK